MGENAIDVKIQLSKELELQDDFNYIPEKAKIDIGGTGVNFCLAFRKLGGMPVYFSPFSTDPFGTSVRILLQNSQVNFFETLSDKPTPVIVSILYEKDLYGQNRTTIAHIKNTSYTDISFETFKNANLHFDFVYVSGGLLTEDAPQREVLKIVEQARTQAEFVFFDPQVRIGKDIPGFLDSCANFFKYADFIFANEKELTEFDKKLTDDFIERGGTIVLKRGKNGAKVFNKDYEYEDPGIKVKGVNIVGAGDTFNAAFIKFYTDTYDIKESLQFANSFAAKYVNNEV